MNIQIQNPLVLLTEENGFELQVRNLYIEGGRITAIGNAPEGFLADRVLDGTDRLVIPGLINCHTHNYMTGFRNLADDVPFQEWLFERVMPKEDRMSGEDAYWAATLGIMEMLRSGTTCFHDMQMHIHQTSRAVAESGIRACIGRGLSGTAEDEGGARRLREAAEEIDRWQGHSRMTFAIAPHAPYTCDAAYLRQAAAEAVKRQLHLHIHLSESRYEVEQMRAETGMSPIAYAKSLGLFEVPAVAAHCVHVDEEDIRILADCGVSVATNPASNMKLGNGFAPVPKMLEAGVNLCIGTDGAASNNALNLFREMGLLVLIHKGAAQSAVAVSASEALKMATINGAKALGLEQEIGSIAAGMKADLALLDLNRPQLQPKNNLVSSLAYSANGSEVETVLVDGEIVMEKRRFTKIDEERVLHEIRQRFT